MSVLRNLAWIRNDLSVTMTDAFASDASVWNASVTCYVVLEKRDRAIKLHKVFGAPRKLWRPFEKVRWGGHGPPGPPCQAATEYGIIDNRDIAKYKVKQQCKKSPMNI